jgi:hypothetical protein
VIGCTHAVQNSRLFRVPYTFLSSFARQKSSAKSFNTFQLLLL